MLISSKLTLTRMPCRSLANSRLPVYPIAPTSVPIGPPVSPSVEGDTEDLMDLEPDDDSAMGEIPPEPNDLDGFGLDASWD